MNATMFWKTMVFSSCVLMVFSLVSRSSQFQGSSQQNYTGEVRFSVKRSPADFAPNGDLSNAFWEKADFAEFDQDAWGKSIYPELSTRVECLWTNMYIYFGFRGRYDSLNVYDGEDPLPERWQLWNRDVVEVFLNPQPDRMLHYYEFEVAPNNQWVDLEIDKSKDTFNGVSWNSGFEHATHIDAKNHIWTTEMRIPLSSMNVSSIHSGTKWRANFFRAAGQGSDDRRKLLAWSIIPGGKTFHVPTRFGVLEFVN